MTNILMILFVPLCLKGRAVLSHLARFQHDHTTAEGWLNWRFIFFQRSCYDMEYKDGQQGVFIRISAKYQLRRRELENNKLTLKAKEAEVLEAVKILTLRL